MGPVTAGSRGQGEIVGGAPVSHRKSGCGFKREGLLPQHWGEEGVSPSALQTAFLPGASERGHLLSKGKSSDQWIHATELVQTTA